MRKQRLGKSLVTQASFGGLLGQCAAGPRIGQQPQQDVPGGFVAWIVFQDVCGIVAGGADIPLGGRDAKNAEQPAFGGGCGGGGKTALPGGACCRPVARCCGSACGAGILQGG